MSAGVLERFRDHMEKKVGKRVPLVVKDIFDRKPMRYWFFEGYAYKEKKIELSLNFP